MLNCFVAASAYDIRYSTSIKQLRSSFDNASRLNDTDILAGNITSPLASSETETFVIRFSVTYNNRTLFFGVKVIHSNQNRVSKVSNIVSAALVYVPPEYIPTTVEQTTEPEEKKQQSRTGSTDNAVFAIKLSFGIAIPLTLLIATPLIVRRVRRRSITRGKRRDGETPCNDDCEPPVTDSSALPYHTT